MLFCCMLELFSLFFFSISYFRKSVLQIILTSALNLFFNCHLNNVFSLKKKWKFSESQVIPII